MSDSVFTEQALKDYLLEHGGVLFVEEQTILVG